MARRQSQIWLSTKTGRIDNMGGGLSAADQEMYRLGIAREVEWVTAKLFDMKICIFDLIKSWLVPALLLAEGYSFDFRVI